MIHHIEDIKVPLATATGILLSFVPVNGNDWLNVFRWIVVLATLCYTVRKWYLMEKENRNNKNR